MSDIWCYFAKKSIMSMEKLVFQIPVDHFQEMYHLHPSVKQTKKLNQLWRDSNSLKEVHTERRRCLNQSVPVQLLFLTVLLVQDICSR